MPKSPRYYGIGKINFNSTLCIRLDFSHLTPHGLTHCICNWLINSIRIHILQCFHEKEWITTHNLIKMLSNPLLRILDFMFHSSRHMFFCNPLSNLWINVWILCSPSTIFTFCLMFIITNRTWINLVSWANVFQGLVATTIIT